MKLAICASARLSPRARGAIPDDPRLQPVCARPSLRLRHSRRHAYGGGAAQYPADVAFSVLNHSAALTSLHAMSRSNSALLAREPFKLEWRDE